MRTGSIHPFSRITLGQIVLQPIPVVSRWRSGCTITVIVPVLNWTYKWVLVLTDDTVPSCDVTSHTWPLVKLGSNQDVLSSLHVFREAEMTAVLLGALTDPSASIFALNRDRFCPFALWGHKSEWRRGIKIWVTGNHAQDILTCSRHQQRRNEISLFFFMSRHTLITHKSSSRNMCPADVEAREKALSSTRVCVYGKRNSVREH